MQVGRDGRMFMFIFTGKFAGVLGLDGSTSSVGGEGGGPLS